MRTLLALLLLPGMFLLASATGVIHVRSASRNGYRDFGVNRRRVGAIREAFGNSMKKTKGSP
jgi:uncharacterized protein (DUF1499 family)